MPGRRIRPDYDEKIALPEDVEGLTYDEAMTRLLNAPVVSDEDEELVETSEDDD